MFSNIFNKNRQVQPEEPFQSWLRIEFNYGKLDLEDLYKFEDELKSIIDPTGLGEVDGDEVATDLSNGTYFIVCKKTTDIIPLIKDALKSTTLVSVYKVMKREHDEENYSEIRYT